MIGQKINNYKIIDKIGEGGMGVVYLGKDDLLDRKVAIKVLHARLLNDESLLERFKSEARILSRFHHTNIASLYNFLRFNDTYCMVMEYVDGLALDDLLKNNQRLPANYAASLISQALDGLRYAHDKGIIHRDLKLANLILSNEGTVKIMDFGIARAIGSSRLTSTGRAIGTLDYMSPEQIKGKEGDEKSDIYSLGIVLYELLTGDVPFKADTEYELMKAHLEQKPASVRKHIQDLPSALDKVVLQALEKQPEKRFGNAQAFQVALHESVPRAHSLKNLEQKLAPQTRLITPPTTLVETQPEPILPAMEIQEDEERKTPLSNFLADEKLVKRIFLGAVTLAVIFIGILLVNQIGYNRKQLTATPTIIEEPEQQQNNELEDGSQAIIVNTNDNKEDVGSQNQEEKTNELRNKTSTSSKKERSSSKKSSNKPKPPQPVPVAPEEKDEIATTIEEEPSVIPPSENDTQAQPEETKFTGRVSIPSNTKVTVELLEDLSSQELWRDGEFVTMKVVESIIVNGVKIIEAGAKAKAKIVDVGKKRDLPKPKRMPVIGIKIMEVQTTANGKMIPTDHRRWEQFSPTDDPSIYKKGKRFTVLLEEDRLLFE